MRPALAAVARRVRLPVLAPTRLSGSSRHPVSVTYHAAGSGYEVVIYLTQKPLPANSPAIERPPNGGLAQLLGGFGGQRLGSAAAARALLRKPAGGFVAPPRAGVSARTLAPRITAETWLAGPPRAVVLWREDGWRLEVNQLPISLLLPYAKSLALYIAAHPLPAGPGTMLVMAAGDGDHAFLAWQRGRVVYTFWDYHSARGAVAMARSATRYMP